MYGGAEEVNLHAPTDLPSGKIPGTSWTGICAGRSKLSRSVEKICSANLTTIYQLPTRSLAGNPYDSATPISPSHTALGRVNSPVV